MKTVCGTDHQGLRKMLLVAAPHEGAWGWVLEAALPSAPAQRVPKAGTAAGVRGKAVKNKAYEGKNSKLDLNMVKQRDLLKTFRMMTQTNGFSSLNWLTGSCA